MGGLKYTFAPIKRRKFVGFRGCSASKQAPPECPKTNSRQINDTAIVYVMEAGERRRRDKRKVGLFRMGKRKLPNWRLLIGG